jgi:hypothetical protein
MHAKNALQKIQLTTYVRVAAKRWFKIYKAGKELNKL